MNPLFLESLNQEELLDLISAYDDYIQEANDMDFYSNGWKPVSISEFYMNEYQER